MRQRPRADASLHEAGLQILLSLATGPKHGYAVIQDIAQRTDGAIRMLPGTLYSTIKRLLQNDWIEECDGPVGTDSDGPARRYYRVTAEGRAAGEAETRRLARLVDLGRVFLS